MSTDWYYKSYSDRGYLFSDEILSRYALSLATKPFVILTGISGTGKSKIAQLFNIPHPSTKTPTLGSAGARKASTVSFTVTEGMISGDGRGNFEKDAAPRVLSTVQHAELEKDRTEILGGGGGARNFPHSYEITIDTSFLSPEKPEIKLAVYGQRAENLLLRIRANTKRGAVPAWDNRDYFRKNHKVGDVIELEKISEGNFKIISVNEKSVVAREDASKIEYQSFLKTQCFISVKSNWVDSTELFGYYNQLTEKYQVTKFLRFILQAKENSEIPHFLILDEMNLSKVEHYFSDFLSCLESRHMDGGDIVQEKITLHSGESFISTNDDVYDEIPSEIEIPLNLYVTGTVNIDDSTHMFSPKVLDRANVIEFNEVNLKALNEGGVHLTVFPDFYNLKLSSMERFKGLIPEVKNEIISIVDILKEDNMHFGFRTISEMAEYLLNAEEYVGKTDEERFAALDIQIIQKVLPKFSGTAAKLEGPIKKLIHKLSGVASDVDLNFKAIQKINIDSTKYPRSLTKLKRMYRLVTTQGFVSFIE